MATPWIGALKSPVSIFGPDSPGAQPYVGSAGALQFLVLTNFLANGPIGLNTATVDLYNAFLIPQSTAGVTLTLPAPTNVAPRSAYVENIGSVAFTMYGISIAPSTFEEFLWNGVGWTVQAVGAVAANPYTNGGNAFGVPGVLGITDANPLLVQSGPANALTLNSGTTGDTNVGTGVGGVDTNAKTVRLGTGAGAKIVQIGSTNTTSSTTINYGTGGLGIGAVAPGGSGATIDTPVAGPILVGPAVATSLAMGNQLGGMTTTLLGGTGGIGIGVPAGGIGFIQLTAGTGASNWTIGTAGTLGLGSNATDHTTTVGSVTGASPTTLRGGTTGSTVSATGAGNVTLTPGVTGNVQFNAAAAATCGVQLGIPVAVADSAGGGTIGANTVTVDIASVVEVNQTTGGQARTVPNPTITTQARILTLVNIGSASFTVLGKTLAANAANSLSTAVLTWSPGATKWFATA